MNDFLEYTVYVCLKWLTKNIETDIYRKDIEIAKIERDKSQYGKVQFLLREQEGLRDSIKRVDTIAEEFKEKYLKED